MKRLFTVVFMALVITGCPNFNKIPSDKNVEVEISTDTVVGMVNHDAIMDVLLNTKGDCSKSYFQAAHMTDKTLDSPPIKNNGHVYNVPVVCWRQDTTSVYILSADGKERTYHILTDKDLDGSDVEGALMFPAGGLKY